MDVRFLYQRPLDTLLATWGLSLILQQLYRSVFGAREVGVTLPDWLMGSVPLSDTIEIPINGLFVMVLTLVIIPTLYAQFGGTRTASDCQCESTVTEQRVTGAVRRRLDELDRSGR